MVITEFGYGTFQTDRQVPGRYSVWRRDVDHKSQFPQAPVPGWLVTPRIRSIHERDEAWQAMQLVETLAILDLAGVDGTFVFQFVSQVNPYDEKAKYDLDVGSSSLVMSYSGGAPGVTCFDTPWKPKASFKAVAENYANH
jgi:hypothetical protein